MKIAAVKTHTRTTTGTKRLSAVDYWRTISPLRAVARATGWQVEELDGEEKHSFQDYDLVWFSYLDNPLAIQELSKQCKNWTVDFDDDFLNISATNPVKQQYRPGSNEFKTILWLIQNAPHLTVSTAHLARVYGKIRDPQLPPPFVLENRIDTKFYTVPKRKKSDNIVFSWQGGLTHHSDLFHTPFWGAMSYILGKHPKAKLKIMGGIPDDFYVDHPQVEIVEGANDYGKFARLLSKYYEDVDVALCPLEDTIFNASKSSIKAQEALVHGVPVIASNVRPYQELASVVQGVTLVETATEWIDALECVVQRKLSKPSGIEYFTVDQYVDRHLLYISSIANGFPYEEEVQLPMVKKGKLNIVLSCLRFAELTGSELYTYELARELKNLGHEVTIVSSVSGEMKKKAENEGIECLDFLEVDYLDPDLIISSHFEPTTLMYKKFTCPIINVIHSENESLWPLERPVVGCDQYVAVRETIKNKIIKEGIHPDKVSVIMNPIDLDRFNTVDTSSNKSILFVGPQDYLRKRVIRDIKKVAKEKGLITCFVGRDQPNSPVWETEKYTKHCEMVASVYVGRTALEGWACGKAAIIYDINGRGKILSKYIVAPPKDVSDFDSKEVAKRILRLVC